MNKKRGFTLIELLAVIVILAIIALIATPIITNVINKTKNEAEEISYDNYLRAVDTTILSEKTNGNKVSDGLYVVNSNGGLCPFDEGINCSKPLSVEMSGGNKPNSGSRVVVENYKTVDKTKIITKPSADGDNAVATIMADYEIKTEDGINYVVLHLNALKDSKLAVFGADIEFDSSKVSISKYVKGLFGVDYQSKKTSLYKIMAEKTNNVEVTGDVSSVIDVYFQIKDGVSTSQILPGDFKIYLSIYDQSGTSIFNVSNTSSIEILKQEELETIFTSSSYVPGDVNNDGSINLLDVLLLRKIVLGTYDSVKSADCNGDGEVDIRDVTRLKKYVTGLDAELVESPMTDVEDYLTIE